MSAKGVALQVRCLPDLPPPNPEQRHLIIT